MPQNLRLAEFRSPAELDELASEFRREDLRVRGDRILGAQIFDFLENRLFDRFDVHLIADIPSPTALGSVAPFRTHDGRQEIGLWLPPATLDALSRDEPRAKATAIHELSHLLAGHHRQTVDASVDDRRFERRNSAVQLVDVETQAWDLTRAILIPTSMVAPIVRAGSSRDQISLVRQVASRFGVSLMIAKIRVERLQRGGAMN